MRTRLLHIFVLLGVLSIGLGIFYPSPNRASRNSRRRACQTNLKQIGLALRQYSLDYDEKLPPANWGKVVLPYMRGEQVLHCSEVTSPLGTSDYFFNSRFLGESTAIISSPSTLILSGDGKAGAPLDATLVELPSDWRSDEKSPAWRHLDTANYAFADGHVKALKVKAINRDFRVVVR